jgi:predicted permease
MNKHSVLSAWSRAFAQASRSLRRQPAHAAIVLVVLGLAIGASTAVFSAVRLLLLTPPPYPAAAELQVLRLSQTDAKGATRTLPAWSYPAFTALRDALGADAPLAAYTPHPIMLNLATDAEPERVATEFVSANYFDVLGVAPITGRTFTPQEDLVPERDRVALIGEALWRKRFNARADMLGADLQLNGQSVRIVGILPAGFRGASENADLWLPMMQAPVFTFPQRLKGEISFWHAVIVRESAMQTLDARLPALAQAIAHRIDFRPALGNGQIGLQKIGLLQARIDPAARRIVLQLLASVILLLLVAISNVANLGLAAVMRRQRELAIRAAVGGDRNDLARLVLAEYAVLAVGCALVGLGVAAVLQSVMAATGQFGAGSNTDFASLQIDAAAAAWCGGMAVLALALAALWPVRMAWSLRLNLAMLGSSAARRLRLARLGLCVAQLALATLLTFGACWLGASLLHTYRTPLPFHTSDVLTARATLPRAGTAAVDAARFFPAVVESSAALPGVLKSASAYCLPLQDGCDHVVMSGDALAAQPDAAPMQVDLNVVSPDYFGALGIDLLRGRDFAQSDRMDAPHVAIVSAAVAKRYFPGQDPIGQRISLSMDEVPMQIVGVVGDVSGGRVDQNADLVYVPFAQCVYEENFIVLRTAGNPHLLVAPLREVVRNHAAGIALWDVASMGERLDGMASRLRLAAMLLGGLGGLALLLAGCGLYSVLSLLVAQRTGEIGVRVALGATAKNIFALVARDAAWVLALGMGLGFLATLPQALFADEELFRLAVLDGRVVLVVVSLLALCTLAASLLPARRALGVNPIVALRHE